MDTHVVTRCANFLKLGKCIQITSKFLLWLRNKALTNQQNLIFLTFLRVDVSVTEKIDLQNAAFLSLHGAHGTQFSQHPCVVPLDKPYQRSEMH